MNYPFEIMNPPEEKVRALAAKLNLSPIVAKIFINRGIDNPEEAERFLNGGIEHLHPPYLIDDLEKAVHIILDNVEKGNKILIHGDYDADGVTSTSILIKALERIGGHTDYYIPDRFGEGYGFSPEAIKKAIDEDFKLIITVDCGSSNREEVAKAREMGLQVIITDHHEVPEDFPEADAFVNTKKPGDTYPFKNMSGAGIAFKLVCALYSELGRDDWKDFLDLAAIGTVADVVPLVSENRILVKAGLELLSRKKRPGVAKLLELVGFRRKNLIPWDISFVIAPRINAAGRLSDATVALKFLLEEDHEEAEKLAARLIKMNEERQQVELGIKKEIDKMINENPDLLSQPVWVLGSRGWHQGVIGIVASRFADSFKRPVFLISIDDAGMGRGSARCGENYSVYEALEASGDLLEHYGGHRFAGGFSLDAKNIDDLRKKVSSPELFSTITKPLKVDAELLSSDISIALARDLEKLSPFGEGNPKPLFLSRRIKFQSVSPVGSSDQHLKVWVSLGQNFYHDLKGIFFGKGFMVNEIYKNDLFYDIIYNLDIDLWNNQEELSLKISQILEPDRDCERIIVGLEEVAINDKSDAVEEEQRLNIIDARGIIERRKYIKNLYKCHKKTLLLTRNLRQSKILMENLKREGVPCIGYPDLYKKTEEEIYVFISPIEKLEEKLDVEEVIFYHPPYYLSHFQNSQYRNANVRRIHLLFGDNDVAREAANQEILAPERETLLKIFAYLKSVAQNGGSVNLCPEQVVKSLKDSRIKTITVRLAFKIFKEIGLIKYHVKNNDFLFRLLSTKNNNLEDSSTFKYHHRMKREFQKIKDLYLSSNLSELKQKILSIVGEQQLIAQ